MVRSWWPASFGLALAAIGSHTSSKVASSQDHMVRRIGFLAATPAPWTTAAMIGCLFIAMLCALRVRGVSKGAICVLQAKDIAILAANGGSGPHRTNPTAMPSTLTISSVSGPISIAQQYAQVMPGPCMRQRVAVFDCRSKEKITSSGSNARVGVKVALGCHLTQRRS